MNTDRTLEILENFERDRKRKNNATVAASIFVLMPFLLIALLVFLSLIF